MKPSRAALEGTELLLSAEWKARPRRSVSQHLFEISKPAAQVPITRSTLQVHRPLLECPCPFLEIWLFSIRRHTAARCLWITRRASASSCCALLLKWKSRSPTATFPAPISSLRLREGHLLDRSEAKHASACLCAGFRGHKA